MIVNAFPVVRMIRVSVGASAFNQRALLRIHESIVRLYGLNVAASQDALIALRNGGTEKVLDPSFTPAEGRLIDTIVRWLDTPIGEFFEDGWGVRVLSNFYYVMENHNENIGVMICRSADRMDDQL